MGLWKYDTIVGLWHMEDGADSKGTNNITLTGPVTVAGKLDNAQSFAINDYGRADGLISTLASVTKGSIAGWINLDGSTGANVIMSCSKITGTGATLQRILIRADIGVGQDNVRVITTLNGTGQADIKTPIDSLDIHYGNWLYYQIDHDGSQISNIYFNNVDQTLTRSVTTDESFWFSGAIAAGADAFTFGSHIQGSTYSGYMNGDLDETMINSELWDADDRVAFWNGGTGQVIEAPYGNRQRFIGKRPILTVDKQIIGNRGNPIIR